jgi:hypothetical protein
MTYTGTQTNTGPQRNDIPAATETDQRPVDESAKPKEQTTTPVGDNTTKANTPQPADKSVSQIVCNKQEFFYPALKHRFGPTEAILIETPDQSNFYDPFGNDLSTYNVNDNGGQKPNRCRKLFVKAEIEDDLIFMDPLNLGDARAIVSISDMVVLNTASSLGNDGNDNPSTKLVPLVASEEFALFTRDGGTYTSNSGPASGLMDILLKLMSPISESFYKMANQYLANNSNSGPNLGATAAQFDDGAGISVSVNPKTLAEQVTQQFHTVKNIPVFPKAALPGFAAVPLVSNQHVYGPWINYPEKQKSTIFPFLLNDTNRKVAIENMIGPVNLEVDNDLVPWNYGGMYALDMAAELKIQEKSTYQQFLETGQLSVPGYPAFSLGDVLSEKKSTIYNYSPIANSRGGVDSLTINRNPEFSSPSASNISNIQVNIGQQTETTYSFRTYQSKLSLYNKENSDRIKKLVVESRKRQKEQHQLSIAIYDRMRRRAEMTFKSSFRDFLYDSTTGGTSPVEVMVGSFTQFSKTIKDKKAVDKLPNDKDRQVSAHRPQVAIFEAKEVSRELSNSYSSKSMMSLDGFFSPVSFYPTLHDATKSFVKYDTKKCPVCKGSRLIEKEVNPTIGYNVPKINIRCEYCEDKTKVSDTKSFSVAESMPPYILASGMKLAVRDPSNNNPTDTILYEYVTDKTVLNNPKKYLEVFGKRNVNLFSLNPIIVASGEFRNINALDNDMGGHGIEIVARGMIPPKNALDVIDNIAAGEVIINSSTNTELYKWDDNLNKHVPDPTAFVSRLLAKDYLDLDYEFRRTFLNTANTNDSDAPQLHPMNQRFFGFRGPMIMHGWGYDMDGYPIPNASGDPKILDAYDRPLKTKNLKTYGSHDPENADYGDIIIGKNQIWDAANSEWSLPFKEMSFPENWGTKPADWPVGPIDLRWDSNRKVWAAPQPVKHVYVTLEEDLTLERNSRTSYPARGFLDDLQFSKDPLPTGLRRVVFVKDQSGYTAPRGAKLYCRYNGDSGFYEPISKQQIIASGVIKLGYNATIFNTYAVPNNARTQDVTKINVQFVNNLNIEAKPNHRALFIYMEGAWNLMSVGRP